ncbi:MAG: LacI family DNA-binding transcriptional regulator [Caldilineaceae bacterium]
MARRAHKRQITIIQVAEACGVSTQTVSRVINNRPDVSDETRQRILEAIRRLNYQPNALARSLIHRRTHTIGVVTSGIDYYGPSRILVGIEEQASSMGYSLLLHLLHDPATVDHQDTLGGLISRQVDGIIWAVPEIGNNLYWVSERLPKLTFPIVFLNAHLLKEAIRVRIDNLRGGQLATQHLIEQGRREIGLITGPLDWVEAVERKRAWQRTIHAAGLSADEGHIVNGDWSPQSGERAMHQLLQQCPKLDAVFVSNDQMTLGALKAVNELGRRVPHDIAMVGFDDIPEASYFQPPLTTIRQPLHDLGVQAVQKLVHLILNEEAYQQEKTIEANILLPELVIRRSSVIPT